MKTFHFLAFPPRLVLLYCALAAMALTIPVPTHSATVVYSSTACSSYTVSGTPPNQTVTCVTAGGGGGGGGVPVCAPTAEPATPPVGQGTTISANCSNGPNANGYVWTGGSCAGTTGATCRTMKSRPIKVTFTVSATNSSGTSTAAPITVTWQ